jgi:hypothetical protein
VDEEPPADSVPLALADVPMLVNDGGALHDGMRLIKNPLEATAEPLPEQPQGEHENDQADQGVEGE